MKTKEVIEILDNINNLLKEKEYQKAEEYILNKKINVMANESKIENYIDEILSDLK